MSFNDDGFNAIQCVKKGGNVQRDANNLQITELEKIAGLVWFCPALRVKFTHHFKKPAQVSIEQFDYSGADREHNLQPHQNILRYGKLNVDHQSRDDEINFGEDNP